MPQVAKVYQFYASGEYAGESDDYGSGVLPNNSTRTAPPVGPWGRRWPRWTGTDWELVPDHRERSTPLYPADLAQKATDYWVPAEGDDWQSQPRQMKEIGPLPDGAVTERPEKPTELALSEAREAKLADFDRVMADIDQRLIRPLANGETDIVAGINSIQARNRERRAQVVAAETVEAVEAIEPVSLTPDGMATLLAAQRA